MKAVWLRIISLLPRQSPPSSSRILIAHKKWRRKSGKSLSHAGSEIMIKDTGVGGGGDSGGRGWEGGPIKAFINVRKIDTASLAHSKPINAKFVTCNDQEVPSSLPVCVCPLST